MDTRQLSCVFLCEHFQCNSSDFRVACVVNHLVSSKIVFPKINPEMVIQEKTTSGTPFDANGISTFENTENEVKVINSY